MESLYSQGIVTTQAPRRYSKRCRQASCSMRLIRDSRIVEEVRRLGRTDVPSDRTVAAAGQVLPELVAAGRLKGRLAP
jgi:hypothetical protein